ncbi:MAG: hypothetical protein CSB06_02490 [Bacteroidia bacterium]|nr:MAG: hypothetical protein CSB06_02490 [Bacteroidia bacterium]
MKKIIILIALLFPILLMAQEEHTVSTGKRIVVNKNGTWKTKKYAAPNEEEVKISTGKTIILHKNGTWNTKRYPAPNKEELELNNGTTVILYSNGRWKKKVFNYATGSFTDSRDGKVYKTVKIGTQWWMAENLAYKASSGCWAYDNNSNNVNKYGYLYNWETAKNVCPAGWHLPSDTEWAKLTDYLGGEEVAGKKLKSANGWQLYEGVNYGNNESGFSALPGGHRYYGGSVDDVGKYGDWWSSTPNGSECAWKCGLNYYHGKVYRDINNRNYDYSVRCLKD